jgi:hypothetical protein
MLHDTPPLPTELISQALMPLPESATLFQEALRGSDSLDESDLGIWKDRPPYKVDSDITSAPELYYTERLVEVLHGVRLREQRAQDVARRCKFSQGGCGGASERLGLNVVDMVEEWNTTRLFLQSYSAGAREMTMAHFYLQWQARTTYHVAHLLFL